MARADASLELDAPVRLTPPSTATQQIGGHNLLALMLAVRPAASAQRAVKRTLPVGSTKTAVAGPAGTAIEPRIADVGPASDARMRRMKTKSPDSPRAHPVGRKVSVASATGRI
jgi:hypothetical protein